MHVAILLFVTFRLHQATGSYTTSNRINSSNLMCNVLINLSYDLLTLFNSLPSFYLPLLFIPLPLPMEFVSYMYFVPFLSGREEVCPERSHFCLSSFYYFQSFFNYIFLQFPNMHSCSLLVFILVIYVHILHNQMNEILLVTQCILYKFVHLILYCNPLLFILTLEFELHVPFAGITVQILISFSSYPGVNLEELSCKQSDTSILF